MSSAVNDNTADYALSVFAADLDGDGVGDLCDVCPGFDDAVDADGDGLSDGCDLCMGDNKSADVDGDGHCALGLDGAIHDCDNTDANIFPGAPELCNGLDDNCDAQVDEGCPEGADTGRTGTGDKNSCGCSASGGGAVGWLGLALFATTRRRKRSRPSSSTGAP